MQLKPITISTQQLPTTTTNSGYTGKRQQALTHGYDNLLTNYDVMLTAPQVVCYLSYLLWLRGCLEGWCIHYCTVFTVAGTPGF